MEYRPLVGKGQPPLERGQDRPVTIFTVKTVMVSVSNTVTPISRSCHQILVDTSSDKEELANFCHGTNFSQLLALYSAFFLLRNFFQ